MINLTLNLPAGRAPRLLFIGAHCDDIEIGCGGTVMELLKRHPQAVVHWVVLSSEGTRKQEAQRAARSLLGADRDCTVEIMEFRGAYFPAESAAIKDYFERLKLVVSPDVIFAHCRDELHQDHRIVGELTWNSFRDHLIFEYEIPKYDGGLGAPSVFVPLSPKTVKRKVDLLMRTFKSQAGKRWFTPETFMALMRLRGVECNSPSGYAEAFFSRKVVFGAC